MDALAAFFAGGIMTYLYMQVQLLRKEKKDEDK